MAQNKSSKTSGHQTTPESAAPTPPPYKVLPVLILLLVIVVLFLMPFWAGAFGVPISDKAVDLFKSVRWPIAVMFGALCTGKFIWPKGGPWGTSGG